MKHLFDRQTDYVGTTSIRKYFTVEVIETKEIKKDNFCKSICKVRVTTDNAPYQFVDILHTMGVDDYKYFTASSTLHKEDKYNEFTGRDIAEHKALQKAYCYIINVLNKLDRYLRSSLYVSSELQTYYMEKADKQGECIDKKIKG